MIGMILCAIIDLILYKIAYKATGYLTTRQDSYEFKSIIHWTTRVLFIIVVIIIGKTGIFDAMLKFLTIPIYTTGANILCDYIHKLTDILTQARQ